MKNPSQHDHDLIKKYDVRHYRRQSDRVPMSTTEILCLTLLGIALYGTAMLFIFGAL